MGPAIPAIIGGIASIGSALIGGEGQSQANEANAAEAQRNRDFQERMRGTQYQTAVEDMKKAGLNPALAYQQGGAGNLSGSTATHQNVAANATASAGEAIQAFQSMRKTAAEINMIEKQTTGQDTQNQILLYKWMSDVLGYQVTKETLPALMEKIRNEAKISTNTAREGEASAKITELGIPEAQAMAAFYRSALGKFSPYVNSAAGVAGGIAKLFTRTGKGVRFNTARPNTGGTRQQPWKEAHKDFDFSYGTKKGPDVRKMSEEFFHNNPWIPR